LYEFTDCTIHWKKGKNVSLRRKHGKSVKQDSFFNYFDQIFLNYSIKSSVSSSTRDDKKSSKSDKEHDDDASVNYINGRYAADFEIGYFFKKKIIPKAVLYFTAQISCCSRVTDLSESL
jgi:hypothetical protein